VSLLGATAFGLILGLLAWLTAEERQVAGRLHATDARRALPDSADELLERFHRAGIYLPEEIAEIEEEELRAHGEVEVWQDWGHVRYWWGDVPQHIRFTDCSVHISHPGGII
jgi:hypothetical protein